jgi:hypothetical protein
VKARGDFPDRVTGPDERIVRWGWTIWLAWGALGAAVALEDHRAGNLAFGLILTAPFWALWLLWPALRALRRAAHFRAARRSR